MAILEMEYAFERPSLQFHDVWRLLCRQSLQLWKFTWGSGAGEPAGNKAAVVPWQIQFPNGCLTWSFHWGCDIKRWILQSSSQLPRLTQVVLEPKEPGQIDGVFGCWRCSEMVGVIQRHRPFPIFSPVFGRLYSDPGNIHSIKESNFISVRLRRIEQRQEGWQEWRVIRKSHNGTILVILSPIRFLHVEFHVLPWPGNLANSLISWPAWRVGFQARFDCKA